MNINIKINPISNDIEKYILSKANLKPPLSYGPITDFEINYIKTKVDLKFNTNINPRIIGSIKSTFMKNYIIDTFYKLHTHSKNIIKLYSQLNIIKLCEKYDISPMTIIRFVFESKYKLKLSQLIKSNIILEPYDIQQLKLATESDIYSQIDQTGNQTEALEFEKKIESILKRSNIKYKTQEDLTQIQIKSHGRAFNTPDFVISSDLIINGVKINWIDAKNFYGSNIKFIKTKIKKQIQKYIDTYGTGLIVFNLGFNEKLKFDHTLILDYEQILNYK
jgi:hypothetical protein